MIGLVLNVKKNEEIHLRIADIVRPDRRTVRQIYAVGVPSVLMISIGSLMTFFMNMILKPFEATAQAVFGAYFKLQSFFFMPVFGLNNGLIPILAGILLILNGVINMTKINGEADATTYSKGTAIAVIVLGVLVIIFGKTLINIAVLIMGICLVLNGLAGETVRSLVPASFRKLGLE